MILLILLIAYLVLSAFVIKEKPHHESKENLILLLSFVANMLLAFVHLVYFLHETLFGVMLIILFYAYLVLNIMLLFIQDKTSGRSAWYRNIFKLVDFTYVKGIEVTASKGDKNYAVFNYEKLELNGKDRRVLVWQRFWDTLFK